MEKVGSVETQEKEALDLTKKNKTFINEVIEK